MQDEAKLVKSYYIKGAITQILNSFFFFSCLYFTDWPQNYAAYTAVAITFFNLALLRKGPLRQMSREDRKVITSKYMLPWYSTFIMLGLCICLVLTSLFVWNWDWLRSLFLGLASVSAVFGTCSLLYSLRMKTA